MKLFQKKTSLSVVDIISKLIKSRYLPEIAAKLQDPRAIFEVSGEYYPGGKSKLLEKVAGKLKLNIFAEFNPEALAYIYNHLPVQKLQSLAVFPVISEQKVVALTGTDPAVFKAKLQIPEDFPVYLSAWQEVQSAWEKTQEIKNELEKTSPAKTKILFQSLLENLSGLLLKHQASNLQIIADLQNPQYIFKSATGDMLSGKISPEINKVTWEYLSNNQPAEFYDARYGCTIKVYFAERRWEIILQEKEINIQAVENPAKNKDTNSGLPNIMLIDDSSIFCEVLKRYLKKEQYQLNSFAIPEKAIQSLEQNIPDLIISDLHMPAYSGEKILKAIRAKKELAQIPFVLLTSDTAIDTKLKLIEAGVDAFIGKNEDPRLIAVQVKSLLKKKQEQECSLSH